MHVQRPDRAGLVAQSLPGSSAVLSCGLVLSVPAEAADHGAGLDLVR